MSYGLGQAAAAQEIAEAKARRARRVQAEQLRAAHTIAVQKIQAKAFKADVLRRQRVSAAQAEYESARIGAQTAQSPQAIWAARDRLAAAQGALNSVWNTVPPAGVPQVGMGSYYRENPMSYAGLGQISTAPGAVVGRDPARHEAGGAVRVGASWAQRAVNAGNRYNDRFAPLIVVDGRAGPVTIAGLRTLSHQFSSDQPVTNDPPATRVTSTVIIPVALETALAARAFVASPPASTATRRTTTTASTGGGGTSVAPTTTPIPGATPAATPADEVILDEGSSTGVRGLIARYGIMPWAIGGAALVALGAYFLMTGSSVRANRRRVRRNVMSEWSIRAASVAGHKHRRLSARDSHALAQRRAEEEGFSGRSGVHSGWHGGRGMPGLGKKRRSVRRNTRYNYDLSHPYKYDAGGRPMRNPSRPLHEIADEIRRDWKSPYFGAVPYLEAMGTLTSVKDNYGYDRGESIVAYFLGNATAWRGPTAKRIKAELNAALKGR